MTWKMLVPPAAVRSFGVRSASPFMVSVSRFGRSKDYRLIVQAYPSKMSFDSQAVLGWWKEGRKVSVRQGLEEDLGKVDITASEHGQFELEKIGSHPQCPIGLRLGLPGHLPKEVRPRKHADYMLGYLSVVVELPQWAIKPEVYKQFDLEDLLNETRNS
jgi:hypothetical protein